MERKLQQREALLTVSFEVYTDLMNWATSTAHTECSQEVLDILERFRDHFEDSRDKVSEGLTSANIG